MQWVLNSQRFELLLYLVLGCSFVILEFLWLRVILFLPFLHIIEPPYFVEKPQSQEVVPNARVQFKALVKGSTPLQIKWFKDSQELLSGANRSVWKDDTSSVLELFSARTSDSGNYTCQISNDVGTATCKAALFVKGVQSNVLLIFVVLTFLCNLWVGSRKPLYFFKTPPNIIKPHFLCPSSRAPKIYSDANFCSSFARRTVHDF